MNPNSRQVYTCISSADKLCMSHTVSIHFFFFFFFRNGGVKVCGARGGCLDMLFSKILPETKSKPSSSQCTLDLFFFFFPRRQRWRREMCKSSVFSLERKDWMKTMLFKRQWLGSSLFNMRRLVLIPFTFPKDGCGFFTPQLFGCSPPLSPPVFSPPQKTRSPFHQSSSFLACLE